MTPLQVAQLLQILLPLGAQVYTTISQDLNQQGANLPPVEQLLDQADKNWDAIGDKALSELAKLKTNG